MADMFGRASDAYGGSFSADGAKITFAADPGLLGISGGVGMLTQQLGVSYTQQVQRIYEIGTNLSFYVIGRTQGSFTVGRILGPRPVALAFYRKYGNGCNVASNHLDLELATGCGPSGTAAANSNKSFSITMKFCLIVSIGISLNANDMMINEQLQVMYASLGMKDL